MKSLLIAHLMLFPFFFVGIVGAAQPTADVKLDLIQEGAMKKLCGYMPQQLKLSETKPEALTKSPDTISPLYGTIEFAGAKHLILLDEPEGHDGKLYVDANGNGDLTDDPPTTWTKKEYSSDNKKLTQ